MNPARSVAQMEALAKSPRHAGRIVETSVNSSLLTVRYVMLGPTDETNRGRFEYYYGLNQIRRDEAVQLLEGNNA